MKTKIKHKRARRFLKITGIAMTMIFALFLLTVVSVGAYAYYHIDYKTDEEMFALAKGSKTTRIYYNIARDGGNSFSEKLEALTSQKTELEDLSGLLPAGYVPQELEGQRVHGAENGIWCAYDEIPTDLKNAFVAIEDQHFFSHDGVDWLRTMKAAANYFLHFDGRFGGSTITQQLIKNISADNEITVARKLREMCRAIHLERHHGKEEILELYLNIVPLSQGCVGVGTAAKVYYGKDVGELTLAECAAIAAVTNSPRRYDPISQAENNRARRDLILEKMYSLGMIGHEEYENALAEESVICGENIRSASIYNWYTETVLADVVRDLEREYGLSREAAEKMTYNGGLQIYTQMDPVVQSVLESYFSDMRNFPSACRGSLRFAMAVTDPTTGDLLGIVGGVGEKQENRILNYATQAIRAPGSALKPLSVYAPALEEGVINWGTVFDDVPISFVKQDKEYAIWPHNSPAVYNGLTDIGHAVAYSKNTISVKVFEQLGAEKSFSYLTNRLGLDTLVRSRTVAGKGKITDLAAAPLALGQLSDGVSVRALTNAYGALANGGVYHTSRSYVLVLDGRGQILLQNSGAGRPAFSRQTASIMTKLLQGVTSYGTAKGLKLPKMVDTAGKTGTSGDTHDKWFVGYTPYLVAGIWCGYEDGGTAVPAELAQEHLDVWDEVMQILHRRYLRQSAFLQKTFSPTAGVVRRVYCRDSGLLPTDACRADARGDRTCVGYFAAGNEPKTSCQCHIMVDYDVKGGGIARENCPNDGVKQIGMIQISGRNFPADIKIGDTEYVYMSDVENKDPDRQISDAEQERGSIQSKKEAPFNQLCPLHGAIYEDEGGETWDPFGWLRKYFLKNAQ